MSRFVVFLVTLSLLTASIPLEAQDGVLTQLYGRGVHQYFAGNYERAQNLLAEAIAGGIQDPRAYYFRGLATLRLGDELGAQEDLRRAAMLEQTPIGRQYDIGRALQRVQGRERMIIERYREDARYAAFQAAERRRQARYGQQRRQDLEYLRRQAGEVQPAMREEPLALPPGAAPASPGPAGEQPAPPEPALTEPGAVVPEDTLPPADFAAPGQPAPGQPDALEQPDFVEPPQPVPSAAREVPPPPPGETAAQPTDQPRPGEGQVPVSTLRNIFSRAVQEAIPEVPALPDTLPGGLPLPGGPAPDADPFGDAPFDQAAPSPGAATPEADVELFGDPAFGDDPAAPPPTQEPGLPAEAPLGTPGEVVPPADSLEADPFALPETLPPDAAPDAPGAPADALPPPDAPADAGGLDTLEEPAPPLPAFPGGDTLDAPPADAADPLGDLEPEAPAEEPAAGDELFDAPPEGEDTLDAPPADTLDAPAEGADTLDAPPPTEGADSLDEPPADGADSLDAPPEDLEELPPPDEDQAGEVFPEE